MREASRRSAPDLVESAAIRRGPPGIRFILRGAAPAMTAAGTAFGAQPSQLACRATLAGERAALWLGPDEQLLLATGTDSERLFRELEVALAGHPHSLVDVSHRQIGIAVAGRNATLLLNGACPLDLSNRAFPQGMCTRTVFGKAEVVLWRRGEDAFHLEVWRSFAGYVGELLAAIGRGLTA
jgi:sarcosine oxidase, subunit gamma